jgi:hypothetical protein
MGRFLVTLGMIASVLLASANAARAEDGAAEKPKDKRTCRRQEITGSHVPRSICHKSSEWVEIDKREKDTAQQLLEGRRGTAPLQKLSSGAGMMSGLD